MNHLNNQSHSSFEAFPNPHFDRITGASSGVESQLSDLRNQVDDLLDAASTDGSSVGARIRNLLDELLVKQEAICWKLRVAKRFDGEAHDVLMADILDSVDRLRIAIDLVARAYSDVVPVV
jgi:hypothetical protein